MCANCIDAQGEISALERRVAELKTKLESQPIERFGIERLAAAEGQLKYYTGLASYKIFTGLYRHIEPHLFKVHRATSNTARGHMRHLCPADEFLMVLMRLRTGAQTTDLAFRFGFKTPSTVSVIFQRWIQFLAVHLGNLVYWPTRQQVRHFLPKSFKTSPRFSAIRCIIDCTEFSIEAPSAISLNAMTYSDYKSTHTIKVLCAITPDGYISLVSKAYPGSISDNSITRKSGILDLCEPGDSLLADKGFTLPNSELQPRALTLIVPPFRMRQAQFAPDEVALTRKIADLRITVENCILRLKYSRLLCKRLPINTLHGASDVIKVAAVLANLRMPLRK